MTNKEKQLKRQKDKTKFDALRTMMSSFTVTVGAIVVAAVVIPTSPVAKIENVQIFQNEIVYQVDVTDEDHALDLSTLVIVLEGQLETYTLPLELGMNVGLFDNLRPNTTYQLHVYGSKGFGNERLDSIQLTTKANSGGAIINYELLDIFDYFLNYHVTVLLNDDEGLYSEVNLYYGFILPEEIDPIYEVIPIVEPLQIVDIYGVPNEHTEVHLYLEATLHSGETVILDEIYFFIPFQLSTYLYIDRLTSTSIHYSFYGDYYVTEGILYKAELYFGHMLVRSIDIENIGYDSYHSEEPLINFTGLKKDTSYKIVVSSTYTNPHTKRTETTILHEEEITTLKNYTIEYEITTYDTYSEVFIYLNDPNHYFQVPYYIIYEKDGEDYYYYDSNTFGFTPDGDGKFVSFIIEHPSVTAYQLIIGVMNQNTYSINHIILDQKIKN